MKSLEEFVKENIMQDAKNKIKSVFQKVFSKGVKKFEENSNFLKDYVTDKKVVNTVKQSFDINNQAETGYVLGEHGGLIDLCGFVETELLNLSDVTKIKDYIKNSDNKEWKLTKVSNSNDCVWFVPALEAWGIDFDSIDEIDCITSCRESLGK